MDELMERILIDPLLGRVVVAIIAVALIVFLGRMARRALARRIPDAEARYHVRKLITFSIYILAVVILTLVFGEQLGNLTVALSVVGAGIAFALQEVIASVAGWVAITFGRFYRTGHRIRIGDTMGDVIDVGILRTTLMECGQWVGADLYNGRIVSITNSNALRQPIYNYSVAFPFLWDEVVVPIRLDSDRDLAVALMERVAWEVTGEYVEPARTAWSRMVRQYLIERESVEPMVTLIADDTRLRITVRYITDYRVRRQVQHVVYMRILHEIDKTEGRVRLSSATLDLVDVPRLWPDPSGNTDG
jgi:small-conductance mechanosensitive channel